MRVRPILLSPGEGNPAATDARTLGYSSEDLANAPEGSELGLGCGNPTAIASIQAGETVVDLGSGAGLTASWPPAGSECRDGSSAWT